MNRYLKYSLACLIGGALAGIGVPAIQKLAAQQGTASGPSLLSSSPQTRIYLGWSTGSDAGYNSVLQINNASIDPWGTSPSIQPPYPTTFDPTKPSAGNSCQVDAYSTDYGNDVTPTATQSPVSAQTLHGTGFLGPINPGQVNVYTLDTVNKATGLSLANSGQRAILYLTCNFKYAHAQVLVVNPGGVVIPFPGLIIPPNRSLGVGPEQLLQ